MEAPRRTTIQHEIEGVSYLATWIPAEEVIVIDRAGKFYATVTNISTFEDAQNYMERWFTMTPEAF